MLKAYVATVCLLVLLPLAGCNRQVADETAAGPATVWVIDQVPMGGVWADFGYREGTAAAGGKLVPVARLIKDGKAINNAMVFAELYTVEQKPGTPQSEEDLLGSEVATVYHTTDDPAHAQYVGEELPLADILAKCEVQFRVVLPEGEEETHRISIDLQ